MKILYGVSGVGLGHSSRAGLIVQYLRKRGHKVKIITYGQSYDILRKDFDVFKINGMEIIFNNGRVKKAETVYYNLKNLFKNLLFFPKILRILREFKPDICITDMEVFTTFISNFYHLPLISIDNQNMVNQMSILSVKNEKLNYLLSKAIVKFFTFNADYYIIFSLLKNANKTNIFFASPLVRKKVIKLKPEYSDKILVYLSRKDKNILDVLKKTKRRFVIYGYNIIKKDKNLEFKKPGTFLKDLRDCKAIFANAGFSLISEAIYLKKPYLAFPFKGHFEQYFNSITLEKMKFGDYSKQFDLKDFENFIKNLPRYRSALKRYHNNPNEVFHILDNIFGNLCATHRHMSWGRFPIEIK